MKLSIVIAYHNEGQDFLMEALNQIKKTCDVKHEIIIVDDHSDKPLDLNVGKNVFVLRHCKNKGVGKAFDTGVSHAHCENIFLMGCDVRFSDNQWASKIVAEIEKNKDTLICTSVVSLSPSLLEVMKSLPPEVPDYDDPFNFAKKNSKYDLFRGAFLKIFMGGDVNPRHILECQWMPREFLPLRRPDFVLPTESYEVPCILGAAYGTTKRWYNYIDGFWGHKFWGTLEPLISLKCWLMGGRCIVSPQIETAHIFNETGIHADQYQYGLYKSYNRMLVSWLLFPVPDKDRLINWLPDTDYVKEAREMIESNLPEIITKRNEYRKKYKITMDEFVTKINLIP
jgi:glycosyltransferase involved in cell wall biosynthesis